MERQRLTNKLNEWKKIPLHSSVTSRWTAALTKYLAFSSTRTKIETCFLTYHAFPFTSPVHLAVKNVPTHDLISILPQHPVQQLTRCSREWGYSQVVQFWNCSKKTTKTVGIPCRQLTIFVDCSTPSCGYRNFLPSAVSVATSNSQVWWFGGCAISKIIYI